MRRCPTTRRTLPKGAGAMAMALGTLRLVSEKALLPQHLKLTAGSASLPDIQSGIGSFLAPAQRLNDGGGTVTAQRMLSQALSTIEDVYPFEAGGIITFISRGIPYFSRLPGGLTGSLVSGHMPKLS